MDDGDHDWMTGTIADTGIGIPIAERPSYSVASTARALPSCGGSPA